MIVIVQEVPTPVSTSNAHHAFEGPQEQLPNCTHRHFILAYLCVMLPAKFQFCPQVGGTELICIVPGYVLLGYGHVGRQGGPGRLDPGCDHHPAHHGHHGLLPGFQIQSQGMGFYSSSVIKVSSLSLSSAVTQGGILARAGRKSLLVLSSLWYGYIVGVNSAPRHTQASVAFSVYD